MPRSRRKKERLTIRGVIGTVTLTLLAAIMVSLFIFMRADMDNVGDSYVNDVNDMYNEKINSKSQFNKQFVYSNEKKMQAEQEAKNSGNGTISVQGVNIKGNWKEDNVDGYLLSWGYLSSIYEGGTLNPATLQEHYNCDCLSGTSNVSQNYNSSSVAHGAYQADSDYSLTNMLTELNNMGYTELEDYILTVGDKNYMSYDSRNGIHQTLLKYREQDFVSLIAAEFKIMAKDYLLERDIASLEKALGKTRYEINPIIYSAMYSINIYAGSNTCKKAIEKINSGMSDSEIINILYDRRKQVKDKDKPRGENERATALKAVNDTNFDAYKENEVVGKTNSSYGKMLKLEGY